MTLFLMCHVLVTYPVLISVFINSKHGYYHTVPFGMMYTVLDLYKALFTNIVRCGVAFIDNVC